MTGGAPAAELLERFLLGALTSDEQRQVEEFLTHNPAAAQTLQACGTTIDALLSAIQASLGIPPTEPEIEALIAAGKRLVTASSTAETEATVALESASTVVAADSLAEWLSRIDPPEYPEELGRLGGYRLLNVLGRGGMGVVFEAEDLQLRRRVALKVLQPSIAQEQAAHDRFLREARAAAAVEHDNIVGIFHVGVDRGMPFLAMPLLRGETLEARLRREERLPSSEVVRLGCELAQGLVAAHECGLIHRDIKPGNVWLDARTGGVKLLDFGLARLTESEGEPLTLSGLIVGTPAYMAPEQAEAKPVDARCDLFSLGCVLYRAATGELPFPGGTPLQILSALANRIPPRADFVQPDVPRALANVLASLMEKAPERRPASATDVLRLLESAADVDNPPPIAPIATQTPSKWRGVMLAVALAVLLGSFLWVFGGTLALIVTNQGELTIFIDDPHVEVIVTQDGAVVHPKTTQRRFHVRPVNGAIEFFDPETGARALTKMFEFNRPGQRTLVSVTAGALTRQPPPLPEQRQPVDATLSVEQRAPATSRFALDFTAPSDDLPPHVRLPKLLNQQQPLTVEMFVTLQKASDKHAMLFSAQGRLMLFLARTGQLVWQTPSGTDAKVLWQVTKPDGLPLGQRSYVAAVSTGTKLRLYVNGVLQGEVNVTLPNFLSECVIGGNPDNKQGAWGVFHGEIDQLRISSVARYDGSFPPPIQLETDADTLAIYDFQEGEGRVLHDRSGHDHHGQIIRATWAPLKPQPASSAAAPPLPATAPFDATQALAHQQAWAKFHQAPVQFTTPSGLVMRLIPPGECRIGLPVRAVDQTRADWVARGLPGTLVDNLGDSSRQHTVRLTQPFYLSTLEFPRSLYLQLGVSAPMKETRRMQGDVPISHTTWINAVRTCNRLSQQDALPPYYDIRGDAVTIRGGPGYRLPTSAEWEFAYRAGASADFPWPEDAAAADYGWFVENSNQHLQVRGQKQPNPFGLHDMAGNVLEWCWDYQAPYFHFVSEGDLVIDPRGPDSPLNSLRYRVTRGGHHRDPTDAARAWFRWAFPEDQASHTGFRIARNLTPAEPASPDSARQP